MDKQPIGLIFPLRDGNNGYFDQSFDTLTQTKQNLINLLNTRPGERRFNPTFGTRLYGMLFEQNDSNVIQIGINILKEDISTWIPTVSVRNISIVPTQITSPNDNYTLQISVDFILVQSSQKGSIDFTLTNIQV